MIKKFLGYPGLLGINRRNACYTLAHNPRKLYPLVDDKLLTKELLERHHLPAPELYFKLAYNFEIKPLLNELKVLSEFVIKPSRGAEGRGILVIVDRKQDRWIRSTGEELTVEDIEYHVSNILAGLFSLGGVDDRAFIEYRIRSHAVFNAVSYRGVPDIRVILYRGVPVMSMLRLPTRASEGRANLHQGAIGVGVNMLTGYTLGGVHRNRLISKHPDTDKAIQGLRVPFWQDILEIATRTYDVFKLGYMGVDFVIDHLLGPLILELNARPGLSIQLANRDGLLSRLERLDSHGPNLEQKTYRDRLAISQNIFAATP